MTDILVLIGMIQRFAFGLSRNQNRSTYLIGVSNLSGGVIPSLDLGSGTIICIVGFPQFHDDDDGAILLKSVE